MSDTQEAMHREFETLAPIGVNENFHVYGKRCADFGYKFATAQSAEKIARLSKVIMPMQDAIDERDEKIARLEAENASLGAQIDRLNDQCDDWKEQAEQGKESGK